MSVFRYTMPMLVERVGGTKFWVFQRDLGYSVDSLDCCAKSGSLTDFSSTPGIYDMFVDHSRVDNAGGIHDALYRTGKNCDGATISRRTADKVWRKVAQEGDWSANAAQAWAGWVGLRVGGWLPWRKYRRENK